MKEKESIPFAPFLIESMRSLGYSFETAIADLIDNSISANSKNIELFLLDEINPYLIVLDDGCGMLNEELVEALRYGSRSPLDKRAEIDLGRFGLGMKSASLSQCRKLTVASKKNGEISCYSWDIDYINEKQNWVLLEFNQEEILKLPKIEKLLEKEHGTYLLLQNFDRISSSTKDLITTLNNYMSLTEEHISLVFHRFLDKKTSIYINNNKIIPKDPFLTKNEGTQILKEENIIVNNQPIKVQPYILPHLTKMTREDIKKAGGKDDLKNSQGFYIYRNKRLIIYGTWFRLYRKEELTKLARIIVDIPSELDYMWSIDIKKSSANLPDIIKKSLYNCIDQSSGLSTKVHTYRGKQRKYDGINYVWNREEDRDKKALYRINRELPQLKVLIDELSNKQENLLNSILDNIENCIPSQQIYLDTSKNDISIVDYKESEIVSEVRMLLKTAVSLGAKEEQMLEEIFKTEPYNKYIELKEKINKKEE